MPQFEPLPIRKILVPLDGSRLAEAVLPAVGTLAERTRALVVLLHVMERDAPASVHGDRHLQHIPDAEAYLGVVRARLEAGGIAVEAHVHPNLESDVAQSIAGHVHELGADLIACCSHGRGGLRDWIWGSLAQQILRRVEQPVLLVHPDARGEPSPFAPRSVLVALDGTPAAESVLPAALALRAATGATLRLVVVVATIGTIGGDRAAAALLAPAATAAALDLETESAERYLLQLHDRLLLDGVETTVQVARGNAVEVALELVAAAPDSLLALATHGRGRLDALWAASIGGRVVARATSPLLIARVPAAASSA